MITMLLPAKYCMCWQNTLKPGILTSNQIICPAVISSTVVLVMFWLSASLQSGNHGPTFRTLRSPADWHPTSHRHISMGYFFLSGAWFKYFREGL